jgi:hypothetical protein
MSKKSSSEQERLFRSNNVSTTTDSSCMMKLIPCFTRTKQLHSHHWDEVSLPGAPSRDDHLMRSSDPLQRSLVVVHLIPRATQFAQLMCDALGEYGNSKHLLNSGGLSAKEAANRSL